MAVKAKTRYRLYTVGYEGSAIQDFVVRNSKSKFEIMDLMMPIPRGWR